MADEYNRLAMYAAPVAPVENRLAQAVLPQGHPSNMLRAARDWIPENRDLPPPQFFMDPRSLSMRNMLRAGLGTAANWLEGTSNPGAIEIGPDTLSPLGAIGVGAALKPAASAVRGGFEPALAKKALQQHMRLHEQTYGPLTGGKHVRHLAESAGTAGLGAYALHGAMDPVSAGTIGLAGVMTPHVLHIKDVYKRLKEIEGRPDSPESVTLLSDNAKSSVPGTVAASASQQPDNAVLEILSRYGLY
jgi:hypothetical protein